MRQHLTMIELNIFIDDINIEKWNVFTVQCEHLQARCGSSLYTPAICYRFPAFCSNTVHLLISRNDYKVLTNTFPRVNLKFPELQFYWYDCSFDDIRNFEFGASFALVVTRSPIPFSKVFLCVYCLWVVRSFAKKNSFIFTSKSYLPTRTRFLVKKSNWSHVQF